MIFRQLAVLAIAATTMLTPVEPLNAEKRRERNSASVTVCPHTKGDLDVALFTIANALRFQPFADDIYVKDYSTSEWDSLFSRQVAVLKISRFSTSRGTTIVANIYRAHSIDEVHSLERLKPFESDELYSQFQDTLETLRDQEFPCQGL